MRLLVVAGFRPVNSRSCPLNRRMAAQPPGPGLGLHPPSVQSHLDGFPLIVHRRARSVPTDESEAGAHTPLGPCVSPAHPGACSPSHTSGSARTGSPPPGTAPAARALRGRQPPPRRVGAQQRPRLGHVERQIRLEAPGVQAHRHVVGQDIGCREIKIDQARQPSIEKENVIRKQIRMDVSDGQIRRPARQNALQRPCNSAASPGRTQSAPGRRATSSGVQPAGPSALVRVGA